LLAIRAEPQANATRLAKSLGITKGAVSQVLKRLEGKHVIAKRSDPAQKNEVTASFTRLGRNAIAAFLARRDTIGRRIRAYLASLAADEATTIRRFLEEMAVSVPDND